MDCVFCKIASKEIPAAITYENSGAVAFLDISPVAPGHTVVISKIHSSNIEEISGEALSQVFLAVQAAVKLLKGTLAPDGFTIGINHGRAAGQAIDHMHVHILPRWADDGGTNMHGVVKNPPESYEATKEKIMKGLKS